VRKMGNKKKGTKKKKQKPTIVENPVEKEEWVSEGEDEYVHDENQAGDDDGDYELQPGEGAFLGYESSEEDFPLVGTDSLPS